MKLYIKKDTNLKMVKDLNETFLQRRTRTAKKDAPRHGPPGRLEAQAARVSSRLGGGASASAAGVGVQGCVLRCPKRRNGTEVLQEARAAGAMAISLASASGPAARAAAWARVLSPPGASLPPRHFS